MIPVNVRVIAGTKRDLKQLVTEGKFREDLFYRLNVLPVSLPPLRERPEDIPVLMEHFLQRYFRRRGEDVPPVSDAVKQGFMRYSWPGNVRELENACERIAQTCTCGTVRIGCMSASMLFHAGPEPALPMPSPASAGPEPVTISSIPAPQIPVAPAPAAVASASVTGPANQTVGGAAVGEVPVSLDDRLMEVEANLITWALKGQRWQQVESCGIAPHQTVNASAIGLTDADLAATHLLR